MKKFLILFVVLFSTLLLAQTPNWTNVKETNISVANFYQFSDGVDIFTNFYGNHIIVQEINALKYYRMDVNGYFDPNFFPKTIESFAVVSPSISGDDSKIRIVYAIGNQIRIQRSFDGGDNWTLQSLDEDNTISSIESVVSNGTLHVVYKKSNQIWYRYNKVGIIWTNPQLVSEGENGEYPRITARYGGAYNDFVYFVWQKLGTHIVNWRKFEVTSNTWENKKYGYEVWEPNLLSSTPAGFNVTSSTIIFYYYYKVDAPGEEESTTRKFRWTWKDLNNNTLDTSGPDENHWYHNKVYSATTSDNKSHVVYFLIEGATNNYDIWRSNSITGYWQDNVFDYGYPPPFWEYGPRYINNSSAGNEVHVIWKDEYGNNGGNNLRYKYDDQTPLAPTGLTITKSANNHPLLFWAANKEPDISYFKIYRMSVCHFGWQMIGQTGNLSYEDQTLSYCTAQPPEQCVDLCLYSYRITAVDLSSHESDPSNTVSAYLTGGGPPSKPGANDPESVAIYEYSLMQNYPNPFNPTTTINYSIKTAGEVTLKVYDMLGTEVASLITERQEAGSYSVEFNAANLPSGMYVYRLSTNNFVDTKKLILLK